MKLTIDRVEHDIVMVEFPSGQVVALPLLLFPDAREGEIYSIEKDNQETEDRRKRIHAKMSQILDRKKKGYHE